MPVIAVGAAAFALGVWLGLGSGPAWWAGLAIAPVGLAALVGGRAKLAGFTACLLGAGVAVVAPVPRRPLPRWAEGTVVDAPESLEDHTVVTLDASTGARIRVSLATSSQVGRGGARQSGAGPPRRLQVGDRVLAAVAVRAVRGFANPGLPDMESRASLLAIRGSATVVDPEALVIAGGARASVRRWIESARDRVRDCLDANLREPARGVMRAMVLGEGAALEREAKESYRRTGTLHVLAVSGLHLVFVAAALDGLLGFVLRRWRRLAERIDVRRPAALVAMPLIAAYAVFAGGQPSAVRATLMAVAFLVARATGRAGVTSAAMALAVMAQLAWWPERLHDPGLQLSYIAVLALLVLAPPLRDRLAPRPIEDTMAEPGRPPALHGIRRAIAGLVATNIAASIATAPVIAVHFGQVTPASLVANLLAVPASGFVVLPLGLAIAAATLIYPPLARLLCIPAQWSCDALTVCLRAISKVPGASLEIPAMPGWVAVALVALIVTLPFGPKRARWPRILAIAVLALAPSFTRWVDQRLFPELRLTVLDVGQGDSSILELPGGDAVLIDGGGLPGSSFDTGERIVGPYLRMRGIRTIRELILSHPHPDHFGGLRKAVAGLRVGRFWDNDQGRQEGLAGEYGRLLGAMRRRHAPVMRPADLCGRPVLQAGVTLEVIAPCPAHSPDLDVNDNSIVLRVTHGKVRLLLAGDIEASGERALVAGGRDLQSDLVKVPHHGSGTSSGPELVAAARPEFAVISVGARNRFSHPADSVVASWRAAGARVLRTDVDGGLIFRSDGARLRLEATGRGPAR
ncbi:MAG: DNA internalization-related competence protein ComEC/Rec2 [Deltaproteobacteria bacterium]|nr:DNA internalization-related competence protein ComEC/Rec2 [Deltaproteobacteria bacterium]